MTRPFQRGDLVRHRAKGVKGRVRDAWRWSNNAAFVAVDVRSEASTWASPAAEWEHYDPDALLRPVQRLLVGIAMCAAMQAGSRIRWVVWRLPASWRKEHVPEWEEFSAHATEEEAEEAVDQAQRASHPCVDWVVLRNDQKPTPRTGR